MPPELWDGSELDKMQVNIIAAIDDKNGIGIAGKGMAWHLPPDLKRFRELTMGKPVVMGRKTWLALPDNCRPLSGRENIVLASTESIRDGLVTGSNYRLFTSLQKVITSCRDCDEPEIFIIGGAQIYAEALRLGIVDKMYLTRVHGDFGCDVFFPEFDQSEWVESLTGSGTYFGENDTKGSHAGIAYEYIELQKKAHSL
jgi:dihydrofolate reductase